jgi:hypothetical protein
MQLPASPLLLFPLGPSTSFPGLGWRFYHYDNFLERLEDLAVKTTQGDLVINSLVAHKVSLWSIVEYVSWIFFNFQKT